MTPLFIQFALVSHGARAKLAIDDEPNRKRPTETERQQFLDEHNRPNNVRRILRRVLWSTLGLAVMVAALLRWGSHLLISTEPLPSHLDGAIVLQGSILGEKARVAGAVLLVQQGISGKILVSVPKESYWGQAMVPIARAYNQKLYGQEMVSHFVFCETDENVDSTEQESQILFDCIQAHGWHSIAVVTSDYHTRRAGIIWRRMLREKHSRLQLWVHGVPDPEFRAPAWWHDRRSAKYWFLECTKLLWTLVER
jgi:uncharacterized SAM-binding protein YcdF (DUF218 family)